MPLRNRDKLDRYRTPTTAVLTMTADIPFWCTLTARESRAPERAVGINRLVFYRRNGPDRKRFRDFIRSLCGLPANERTA